jgi:hypothetical protein
MKDISSEVKVYIRFLIYSFENDIFNLQKLQNKNYF